MNGKKLITALETFQNLLGEQYMISNYTGKHPGKITGYDLRVILEEIVDQFKYIIEAAIEYDEELKKSNSNSQSIFALPLQYLDLVQTISYRAPGIISRLRKLDAKHYVPIIYSPLDCARGLLFLTLLWELSEERDFEAKRRELLSSNRTSRFANGGLRTINVLLDINIFNLIDIETQKTVLWNRVKEYMTTIAEDKSRVKFLQELHQYVALTPFVLERIKRHEIYYKFFSEGPYALLVVQDVPENYLTTVRVTAESPSYSSSHWDQYLRLDSSPVARSSSIPSPYFWGENKPNNLLKPNPVPAGNTKITRELANSFNSLTKELEKPSLFKVKKIGHLDQLLEEVDTPDTNSDTSDTSDDSSRNEIKPSELSPTSF